MAISAPASLSKIIAEFGGPSNLSAYVRGGSYVPNTSANQAISTTAAGLAISQFVGASKGSSPLTITSNVSSLYASNTTPLAAGTVSGGVTLTCSGGTGNYNVSATVISTAGGQQNSTTAAASTTSGNCTMTFRGVIPSLGMKTGKATVRYTVSDGSSSAYVDVAYTFDCITTADGGDTCVAVSTIIDPVTGSTADSVAVNDELYITDPYSYPFEVVRGRTRKSETHTAHCYRVVTENGASLICSDSAPLATMSEGFVTAHEMFERYRESASGRIDDLSIATAQKQEIIDGSPRIEWSSIVLVEDMGMREVQLIFVEDRAFWASEDGQLFILHHNAKRIK